MAYFKHCGGVGRTTLFHCFSLWGKISGISRSLGYFQAGKEVHSVGTGSRAPNGSRIPPKYAKQCRKWEVGGDRLLPIALLLESGVGGCMLAAMGQYPTHFQVQSISTSEFTCYHHRGWCWSEAGWSLHRSKGDEWMGCPQIAVKAGQGCFLWS